MVVCALPCVSAVVALTFMPESPRFYLEVRERQYTVIQAVLFSLFMTLIMILKKYSFDVCRVVGFSFIFICKKIYSYIADCIFALMQRFLKL